jgi:hypothetical protein
LAPRQTNLLLSRDRLTFNLVNKLIDGLVSMAGLMR